MRWPVPTKKKWPPSDLHDLSRLLHEEVVVLEAEVDEVLTLDRRVGAGHGDDLGVLRQQEVASVIRRAQQLERAAPTRKKRPPS